MTRQHAADMSNPPANTHPEPAIQINELSVECGSPVARSVAGRAGGFDMSLPDDTGRVMSAKGRVCSS